MNKTVTLIEKIAEAKEKAGLNESQFAKRLGISRALWFQLKQGKRKPSARFLSAVMQAFPNLTLDVMAYLSQS